MNKHLVTRLWDVPRLKERITKYLTIHDLKACSLVCRAWYAVTYPLLQPFVKTRAMDVPELVAMVAQYLEPTDLKACALVCRAWYNSFNPYVWSTFVLNGVPEQDPPCCCSSSSPSAPSVISSSSSSVPTLWATTTEDCQIHPRCCKKQAVYKNASFIRHLVVRYVDPSWHPEEFYALFTEKCNSLRSLSLIVDSIYQEYISCLLRANPRVAEHVSHFLMPDLSGQSSLEPPHSKVVTIGDVDE